MDIANLNEPIDLAPGEWPVEVVNRHGRTQTVTLTVLAAEAP